MFFSMTSGGLAVVALGVFVACVVLHAPFHPVLLKHHGSSGTIFAPLLRRLSSDPSICAAVLRKIWSLGFNLLQMTLNLI